jgi:hypothetical protein
MTLALLPLVLLLRPVRARPRQTAVVE